MAHIDIFKGDAFRVIEMSEAVNEIPIQWGRVGELGIFTPKPIRGTTFSIENKGGVLQLISSSERGTSLPAGERPKRKLRPFETERFGLKSTITASDVDGIRAFGSESELVQVAGEVAERQTTLRGSVDITREYLRCGALQGIVMDADGSEILDLYDAFGITRKEVNFELGTASTELGSKAEEVVDYVRTHLLGDVMTGARALCGPDFWNGLMAHDDFRARFRYFENNRGADPERTNVSGGFEWKNIIWEKYLAEAPVPQEDGSAIVRRFVPSDEAVFFPEGTRQTFRDFNGSADYMPMVNQPGQPFYSAVFPDVQQSRFVDVEVMMQTLPMCLRPGALVRGRF
ncbi:major capsid protein [Tropicibacter sp. R16_0]|uniref:major capsid protein n=1 Tax=Tropicibacter sp. R16_0 TaxID=2821102 RepID=UPI001ADC2075|nr:major capsid protein [Tropicibacter sp. R16_0]MBO9451450.1 major capsid protein [Tropicibacter sp. R16_0]